MSLRFHPLYFPLPELLPALRPTSYLLLSPGHTGLLLFLSLEVFRGSFCACLLVFLLFSCVAANSSISVVYCLFLPPPHPRPQPPHYSLTPFSGNLFLLLIVPGQTLRFLRLFTLFPSSSPCLERASPFFLGRQTKPVILCPPPLFCSHAPCVCIFPTPLNFFPCLRGPLDRRCLFSPPPVFFFQVVFPHPLACPAPPGVKPFDRTLLRFSPCPPIVSMF